jgi:molybdopterin converting factor subunit 1
MSMRVKVKLFAAHRQLLGRRELELEVAEGATVGQVWKELQAQQPRLADLSNTLVAAVNHEYAPLNRRVAEGDEVAFIPPVSGGEHV